MNKIIQKKWIDHAGMVAIALVSLGYVLFGSSFAQIRIEPSFLNFPIFIGEVLLGFCLLLFMIKEEGQKSQGETLAWAIGGYLLFFLLKAFYGYFVWGPLAFRDAALFYYPFFILMGYSFWSRDFLSDKARLFFIAVIIFIFIFHQFQFFWPCSLIIMGTILALPIKKFWIRLALLAGIFLLAPYEVLFNVYLRTVFLSSLVTWIYLIIIFFLLYCRKQKVRIVGLFIGGLILCFALFKASQTDVGKTFEVKNVKPSAASTAQEPDRGKYLFHPVGSSPDKPNTMQEFIHKIPWRSFSSTNKVAVQLKNVQAMGSAQGQNCALEKNLSENNDSQIINIKKDDSRFRYYIWRDMAHEIGHYKPMFGFDFGRPLISSTMKHYRIISTEDTDGWVGAHNSFFYMIYRAGIIGLAMVITLISIWFWMLRDFYKLRDWTGLLLCAVLLNWFVSANFFLIFELPYTAIPVWTIFGLTLKHRMLLKK